jgi:LPXTG-motif cell wall-anchored protein
LALNSTPRRSFGVALGVVLTGVTAGLIGFAGVASAHTPKVSAECKGDTSVVSVNLTQYSVKQGKTNHVQVLDGKTVLDDKDFADKYKNTFKVSGAVDHEFIVHIKAWDDPKGEHGWTTDATLDVKACVTVPPSSSTTSETTTTTTTTTTEVTTPPSSSTEAPPVVATSTTTPPPAAQGGPLAETGASIALPLGIAGVLIIGGAGALFVVRRRSKA